MTPLGILLLTLLLAGSASAQTRPIGALHQLQGFGGDAPAPEIPVPEVRGAPVAAQPYSGGPDRSRGNFNASGLGFHVQGTFSRFTVEGWIDRADFTRSRLTVLVESASIQCKGAPEWMVRKMLGAHKFPTMSFKTTAIRPLPRSGRYEVDLDVTSQGQTHPETIVVTVTERDADSILIERSLSKAGKIGEGSLGFATLLSRNAPAVAAN